MKQVKLLLLLVLFSAATTVYGQAFKKGTNVIALGIGLGSSLGYSYGSISPAFSAQYEKGLWEVGPGVISLGGYVGFISQKYTAANYKQKWNYTIIGVRSAYHYTGFTSGKLANLDLYAGVMASYHITSYSYNYYGTGSRASESYPSALDANIYVGGRYYFTNNIAAFAEAGYGISYLTLGLAFKF